ncbi:hypothetical protein KIW84_065942 [Lathyrus oleraceus]|uniref:RRM domain-containing protein n=1 Tax=Pisum sativum TaxID=3888 RepID=A0A9D4WGS9_PEA|nr:hypothetical protein KIW84_065942 [Pisum sativum]
MLLFVDAIFNSVVKSEMGTKAKKAMKKNLKRVNAKIKPSESADFLPLAGGPGRKLPELKPLENTSPVLYIGRIPHGFYEKEMEAYFAQFGTIKRLRIARNKKVKFVNLFFTLLEFAFTFIDYQYDDDLCFAMFSVSNHSTGKSRHYGFIEFESPEVAKIVADTMHNYLLFEHLLQVYVVPSENVHPRLWKGFNYRYKPLDSLQIERERHDKERTLEEHKKLVDRVVKRDKKRRKRIEAAGIDYECPEIVGNLHPAPKKIKFED